MGLWRLADPETAVAEDRRIGGHTEWPNPHTAGDNQSFDFSNAAYEPYWILQGLCRPVFVMENEAATIESVYSDYLQSAGRWIPRKSGWKVLKTSRTRTDFLRGLGVYGYQRPKPSPERFRILCRTERLWRCIWAATVNPFCTMPATERTLEDCWKKTVFAKPIKEDRQNCAAAAITLMAKRFSHPPAKDKAAALVFMPARPLNEVKQTLEEAGLYCLAVQTNLDQLRRLPAARYRPPAQTGPLRNCRPIEEESADD